MIIPFEAGMMTVCGLEYTDGRETRLCIVSGNPLAFEHPYFSAAYKPN